MRRGEFLYVVAWDEGGQKGFLSEVTYEQCNGEMKMVLSQSEEWDVTGTGRKPNAPKSGATKDI